MKNRFELIIFDWDGTLVDSVDWIVHCIQQAARQHGCRIPETQAVKDIIGLSIENALTRLFPDTVSVTRQKLATDYAQIFSSRQTGPDDLFPGVYDMLCEFKRNDYRLAIATGKKAAGLTKAIKGAGVAELFCTTRGADQTASKPSPLMIDEIIAELNIDKQRALMVGDSIHDLQMALNAGIAAIGVTCGAHTAETLSQYGPLMCLNYPTDLLEII